MTTTPKYLHDAMKRGRMERLKGNNLSANPYPKKSKRWRAFRTGWSQSFHPRAWDVLSGGPHRENRDFELSPL